MVDADQIVEKGPVAQPAHRGIRSVDPPAKPLGAAVVARVKLATDAYLPVAGSVSVFVWTLTAAVLPVL